MVRLFEVDGCVGDDGVSGDSAGYETEFPGLTLLPGQMPFEIFVWALIDRVDMIGGYPSTVFLTVPLDKVRFIFAANAESMARPLNILFRDATDVAGIKNVTMNEPFFVGHFPEEPVMPGVLIVEAMAQCSGILVLGDVPDPENYSTYFMKIDGVKFKRKVVPGDTLQFEIHLMEPIRRGVAVVEAKAFVGETLACEAVLMAQVVKNKNNK